MVHIDLPKELQVWQAAIQRQLYLSAIPVRDNLRSLHVRLELIHKRGQSAPNYRCEVTGHSTGGTVYRVTAQHSDGLTAIADACSRTRRTLSRDRRQMLARRGH